MRSVRHTSRITYTSRITSAFIRTALAALAALATAALRHGLHGASCA
jgi:hypothetical protein